MTSIPTFMDRDQDPLLDAIKNAQRAIDLLAMCRKGNGKPAHKSRVPEPMSRRIAVAARGELDRALDALDDFLDRHANGTKPPG
jgi:hypothetical protein